MTDDHASHAMSCYGSRINRTPQLDRLAHGGVRFQNSFCTNAICGPSRAAILTGEYNHRNGVTTLDTFLDNRRPNVMRALRAAGYQTALFGKWHLGHGPRHDPVDFDVWKVLPDQGDYLDPTFLEPEGRRSYTGYVTDLITDMTLNFLRQRDRQRPFCVMCHHKAPHRWWIPAPRHARLYEDLQIPLPETLYDDYAGRARPASVAEMRINRDLNARDIKQPVPEGLSEKERTQWLYQRFIKDYLRCVAAVDEGVGRLLDYLDEEGLAEDTIVLYTSDQGFFLGDHGWYDKRFMYEESLRMPLLVRYPRQVPAGAVRSEIVLNVDFAPTLLDYAGVPPLPQFQGRSFRPVLAGSTPQDWQRSMYYRYWMHLKHHNVYAHYGVRTHRYKLIFYYAEACGQPGALDDARPPVWELFDLQKDPLELKNVYEDPAYARVVTELREELHRLQKEVGDEPSLREDVRL